jgi:hypothetical protein
MVLFCNSIIGLYWKYYYLFYFTLLLYTVDALLIIVELS